MKITTEELEAIIEDCPQCNGEYPTGGSHYHCAQCGKESSMMGHLVKGKFACQEDNE